MTHNNKNKHRGKERLYTKVRTAKGRKLSSTRWLTRHINDPYVRAAHKQGYRARAAYKLLEMDDRFGFLKPRSKVIDLGAAPGSWTQVAIKRTRSTAENPHVLALDILPLEPLAGAYSLQSDFLDEATPQKITTLMGDKIDIVLSDMAAPATGHRNTDHLRTLALAEAAAEFAFHILAPGGTFCVKMFQGGTEKTLRDALNQHFEKIIHVKPKASRAESVELYVLALGKK